MTRTGNAKDQHFVGFGRIEKTQVEISISVYARLTASIALLLDYVQGGMDLILEIQLVVNV